MEVPKYRRILLKISGHLLPRLSDNKLGRMMSKLKFRKARVRGQRGYWVVPFEWSEIAANKTLLAKEAEADTCTVTTEEIFDAYGHDMPGATIATLF